MGIKRLLISALMLILEECKSFHMEWVDNIAMLISPGM